VTPRRSPKRIAIAGFVALLLAAAWAPALAEEASPGEISTAWVFWVAPGHQAQFEAATKEHAAWRKSAGEGFHWTVYQPVVGKDLDHYVIRSRGHHWADLDTQAEWQMSSHAVEKYMEQMGPHVTRVEHYLGRDDEKHSHWIPGDYRYIGLQRLQLVPGAYGRMTEALDKLVEAARAKNFPRSWGVTWAIGGEGRMVVATGFKNYADMAEPDPPFMKVMTDALGSAEAARSTMEQLQGSFSEADYTIYAIRPDLSTPE